MIKWILVLAPMLLLAHIQIGVEAFFADGHDQMLKNKKIVLITNHTAVDQNLTLSAHRFTKGPFTLSAIWTPEHGLEGISYAAEKVGDSTFKKIPVLSLHGEHRRPTPAMLKNIDAIVYDIQDIGLRSYTFASTLYYVMEAAAEKKVPVIVLDRPNPLSGLLVDGPMMESTLRSFVGYLNVPYAHGMTIGELAQFFNREYKVQCDLKVVSMKGWKRWMTFGDTKRKWVPTSPHIPEMDTPLFCAATGILGELGIVNIGVGYTLPFKVVGAPWINADQLATALNNQKLDGVRFLPFHFRPFYGLYKAQDCHGVLIDITDKSAFRPVSTQYMLMGMLKSLYPKPFVERLNQASTQRKDLFCKVNGNRSILDLLIKDPYPAWKCVSIDETKRSQFMEKRKAYLLY